MAEKKKKPQAKSKGIIAEIAAHYKKKTPLEWWAKAITWAVELIVAYEFSELLQSFTDSALWLPSEFRDGIAFGCSVGFMAVSELVSLVGEKYFGKAKYGGEHISKRKRSGLIWRTALAVAFLIPFFICIWNSHKLRTASIWSFTPQPGWWAAQYGNIQTTTFVTNQTEILCSNLPDFLSQERKVIYLPPEISDPKLSNYLFKVGHSNLLDGIKITLDREPMRLIDWGEGEGQNIREYYSFQFLIYHFFMIFFMACAVGILQKKAEIAFEALLKFLPGLSNPSRR